uniref:Uncharacterized protein n=1 Tax=Haemonchus contortus TaxID=6289 RepID=W6NC79_HAECO
MRNRSGHCRHGTPCCNGLICSAPSSLNRKYSGTLNREHLFGRSEDDGSCRGVGQMSDRRTSGRCHTNDASNKAQELGHAAKEKMHDAGRAVKNAAEKVGDKAEELKDKAKQKWNE